MPNLKYALESGGPRRLEISWGAFWRDFTIKLDGNPIGTISGQKELKAGREFTLPDDSILRIQLVQSSTSAVPDLEVLRNGEPLPGSASDPAQKLKLAYGMVFFVAGLNILLGLVAALLQIEFLQSLGVGVGSALFGVILLALGFFVKRRSAAALIAAIVLLALDGLLGIVLAVGQGYTPTAGLVARVLFIIPMIQGVGAIRALKQQPPRESQAPHPHQH